MADWVCAYVYLIELAGGTVRYIPIHPPKGADSVATSGNHWSVDMQKLEDAISSKTKMLVSLNIPNSEPVTHSNYSRS